MPFASYTLRLVFWPIWAWEARLHDGSITRGFAVGKLAARWKARNRIRAARSPPAPDCAPQVGPRDI